MKHTQSAGGVVLNKRGEVLVVNQRGISWSLPKGHVEKDENKIEAAEREIFEESGIKNLELIKELGSYQRHRIGKNVGVDDKTELKTIFMFLFRTDELDLKPQDKHNPEARWVEKSKVAGLLTHPKDKDFFLSIIDKIKIKS